MFKISEDVIETINHEVEREGIGCLARKFGELQKEQSLLYREVTRGTVVIGTQCGAIAGELSARLCIMMYKMIEAQFEVDTLEKST